MFYIHILPQLKDNYSYILHDKTNNITCVIDPSCSEPVIEFLESRNLKLDYILNTHHHYDHIGGNKILKEKYKAKIIASCYDLDKIEFIDISLKDKDEFLFPSLCKIIHTPGHTLGHIAYYFPIEKYLFSGDTLFSIGCGRLFEGTASQMIHSLIKLANLPPDTLLYPGHEYTLNNLRFALSIEPNNESLVNFYSDVSVRINETGIAIPTTIGTELLYNPFLKLNNQNIKNNIKMNNSDELSVFTKLRKIKDNF